jgi:hypothetical protein
MGIIVIAMPWAVLGLDSQSSVAPAAGQHLAALCVPDELQYASRARMFLAAPGVFRTSTHHSYLHGSDSNRCSRVKSSPRH